MTIILRMGSYSKIINLSESKSCNKFDQTLSIDFTKESYDVTFFLFLKHRNIVSSLSTKNSVFKPFLIAGIVLVIFGIICLWLAQIIQFEEEGEGCRIIGWRFVISGIVSIIVAYLSKYFSYYIWRKIKGSKYDDLYKP